MEKTRGEMRKAEKRRFGVLFKNGFGMWRDYGSGWSNFLVARFSPATSAGSPSSPQQHRNGEINACWIQQGKPPIIFGRPIMESWKLGSIAKQIHNKTGEQTQKIWRVQRELIVFATICFPKNHNSNVRFLNDISWKVSGRGENEEWMSRSQRRTHFFLCKITKRDFSMHIVRGA
jgi:hypothetical protein